MLCWPQLGVGTYTNPMPPWKSNWGAASRASEGASKGGVTPVPGRPPVRRRVGDAIRARALPLDNKRLRALRAGKVARCDGCALAQAALCNVGLMPRCAVPSCSKALTNRGHRNTSWCPGARNPQALQPSTGTTPLQSNVGGPLRTTTSVSKTAPRGLWGLCLDADLAIRLQRQIQ